MIPKNKRRTIVVNGNEYEYCVTRCVAIYIKNLKTKASIKWHQEWKEKWKQPIKPSNIRELILTGKLFGTNASRYERAGEGLYQVPEIIKWTF